MNQVTPVKSSIIVACITIAGANAIGQETFRGIELDQTFNQHFSNPFMDNWFIDLMDNFVETPRANQLAGSHVDTISIGFVPPSGDNPTATEFGRWMGSDDYVVDTSNGGSVARTSSSGIAVACIPWRVTPELGDFYLIEMTANVAEGETVRLGYFGDVNVLGSENGLAGDLGQLVLGVTRGAGDSADEFTWNVDSPQLDNPFSDTFTFDGSELRLQLGWNEDEDRFDAWLGTTDGEMQLAYGTLGGAIDVIGVGLEMTGNQSNVSNFIAAVPEPTCWPLALVGLLALMKAARTRSICGA